LQGELSNELAGGRADGVEELRAGERLVEERGAGGAKRAVGLFADRSGGEEDEPVADGGAAGRHLAEELEPVDAVEVEVRHDQIDPLTEVLAGLVGAGHGEGGATGGL